LVSVGNDKKAVGDIAAKFIIEEAKKAIASTGRFTVAFSGGSLPKIVGPALVEKKVEDTDKWFVFFSDERCVKLSSDDSNYKSVREFVLDPRKEKDHTKTYNHSNIRVHCDNSSYSPYFSCYQ